MREEEYILEVLKGDEIIPVGDLVRDVGEEHKYFIFIPITRSGTKPQTPTNYKLRQLSEQFERKDLHVTFLLVDNGNEDLQSSIKATLFRFFPNEVRNAFVASEEEGVTVWVEPKKALTKTKELSIVSKIENLVEALGCSLEGVRLTSTENVPSRTACLISIRLKSPISKEDLSEALIARGFHIPNEDWLSRVLDKLRRSGFVIRRRDGQFILTLLGLKSLGTAKNRQSPDILRVLDIAKRGE